MNLLDIIIGLTEIVAVVAMGIYATWLLTERLRRKESRRRSFTEWIRNIFEAVMGL